MSSMKAFHTRDNANEGLKVPLHQPDGLETEHWLRVLGVDSDTFREAEASLKRELASFPDKSDTKNYKAFFEEKYNELRAVLVSEWSFDAECTLENVKQFFRDAPQIADMVNQVAGNRSLFFKNRSSS